MRDSRRLALRRETLTELTDNELAVAAGGSLTPTEPAYDNLTWKYSLHQHCSWTCI